MKQQPSLPVRILRGIWRVVDGARKLVLNLVFFLLLYLVVVALIDSGDHLIVQPETALILRPQGIFGRAAALSTSSPTAPSS